MRRAVKNYYCASNNYARQDSIYDATPRSVINSFAVLMQERKAVDGERKVDKCSSLFASIEKKTGAHSAITKLFSALTKYTDDIHEKKRPSVEYSRTMNHRSIEEIQAAAQMLLLTSTDDLCSNALYPESIDSVRMIIGVEYVDDFVNTWQTWDQWWRDAEYDLASESLLDGCSSYYTYRSPIEAYVSRYERPIMSRCTDSVVSKIKSDYYLSPSSAFLDRTAHREKVKEMNKHQERNLCLRRLALERMKGEFINCMPPQPNKNEQSQVDTKSSAQATKSHQQKDGLSAPEVDELMKHFFNSCMEKLQKSPAKT